MRDMFILICHGVAWTIWLTRNGNLFTDVPSNTKELEDKYTFFALSWFHHKSNELFILQRNASKPYLMSDPIEDRDLDWLYQGGVIMWGRCKILPVLFCLFGVLVVLSCVAFFSVFSMLIVFVYM